jgi:hypothetical protein
MRLMLAIFVPWLGLLTIGKPFQAFFCFLLQISVVGWLPAIVWSVTSVSRYYGAKKMDRFAEAIKASHPIHLVPGDGNVQPQPIGEHFNGPRSFDVQRHALEESVRRSQEASIAAGPVVGGDGIAEQKANERAGSNSASMPPVSGQDLQDEAVEKLGSTPLGELSDDMGMPPRVNLQEVRGGPDERSEGTVGGGFRLRASESGAVETGAVPPKMTGRDHIAERFAQVRTLSGLQIGEFPTRTVIIGLLYLCLVGATFALVPQVHDWVSHWTTESYNAGSSVVSVVIAFVGQHLVPRSPIRK